MGGLLHLVQRGADWTGCVTARPSTASVQISYYLMWHCNYLCKSTRFWTEVSADGVVVSYLLSRSSTWDWHWPYVSLCMVVWCQEFVGDRSTRVFSHPGFVDFSRVVVDHDLHQLVVGLRYRLHHLIISRTFSAHQCMFTVYFLLPAAQPSGLFSVVWVCG